MLKGAVVVCLAAVLLQAQAAKLSTHSTRLSSQRTGNLAEVAAAAGFSTLVDLVGKAGLGDTLSNGGPFTVFAPTNEAFAALDPATVNFLVENPEELKKVLLYHVLPEKRPSSSLRDTPFIDSAQGATLRLNFLNSPAGFALRINEDVTVTQANIPASNGVIHVIDKVLIPPAEATGAQQRTSIAEPTSTQETRNLAEVAAGAGFSTLVDLVVKAGLADTLSNGGPFTVFAPTNEAFAALDPALVESLVSNPEALKKVLLYHVVSGKVLSSQLSDNLSVKTVQGAPIKINIIQGYHGVSVKINNAATVTKTDIPAKNGVIHVIDQVLIPPQPRSRVKGYGK